MFGRRGQGISINVIIIAAIAIIVMVLLVALVFRSARTLPANECQKIPGAKCVDEFTYSIEGCGPGFEEDRIHACTVEGDITEYCCIPI